MRASIRTPKAKRVSPRALGADERQAALDVMHSERFVDLSPQEIHATLLDEGSYICSVRTLYRILAEEDEVRDRRDHARHPAHRKPELVADGPNQVWSWDITRLATYTKWSWLYLYVILDIFSRYAVGWMLADRENAGLAKRLISESVMREGIEPEVLTLHSDRGAPMTALTTAQLLSRLQVTPSFNRPRVSNDNPYSESHFRTVKDHPRFPKRFSGFDEAHEFSKSFFSWYNHEHAHSGIAYLTPATVHLGKAEEVVARRQQTMDGIWARHPERFVNGRPVVPSPPKEVWINRPKIEKESENAP